MSRPIGVTNAAFLVGVNRTTIHHAMESGALDWVDFGGHQVTTKRWLSRWRKAHLHA